MNKETRLNKEIRLKRSMYIMSMVLILASGYMYWIMDKSQVHLQAPAVSILPAVEGHKAEHKKDNPYVIRNGSNAMPKGMGQNDSDQNTPKFMPQWQKDRIKDLGGVPYSGSLNNGRASSPQPTTNPAPTTTNPRPNVDQGQGVTPDTFDKGNTGGPTSGGLN